jgi:hypothetical protein
VHQGVVHLQGQGLEEDVHRLVQATGLEQGVALGVEEVGVARGVGRVGVEDLGTSSRRFCWTGIRPASERSAGCRAAGPGPGGRPRWPAQPVAGQLGAGQVQPHQGIVRVLAGRR